MTKEIKTVTLKMQALAKHLDCPVGELFTSKYDEDRFEYGGAEYLVLTDSEADDMCYNQILTDLWAFNADFIASHSKAIKSRKAIEAIEKMQGELCEDANEIVQALIDDLEYFVKDAISSDGRGHFLSQYDGEEQEVKINDTYYFIYRTN